MIDLRDRSQTASSVCQALCLSPHPEGGHYREVWRDTPAANERGTCTSIFFLLAADERSHWHRIDATEIWLWQAGAPLLLTINDAATGQQQVLLGPDLAGGEALQGVVPARAWQEASSLGSWTLVSCIVAPAFQFDRFELAPAGWSPDAT